MHQVQAATSLGKKEKSWKTGHQFDQLVPAASRANRKNVFLGPAGLCAPAPAEPEPHRQVGYLRPGWLLTSASFCGWFVLFAR